MSGDILVVRTRGEDATGVEWVEVSMLPDTLSGQDGPQQNYLVQSVSRAELRTLVSTLA